VTVPSGISAHLSVPLATYGYLWLPMATYWYSGFLPANGEATDENHIRKMQLAITVLLEEPDDLNSALETELRLFRDKLHVLELEYAIS
jgi:hypothetical protein